MLIGRLEVRCFLFFNARIIVSDFTYRFIFMLYRSRLSFGFQGHRKGSV